MVSMFSGSISEAYEEFLVPIIFHPFSQKLITQVPLGAGQIVLELACGTGAFTSELVNYLPNDTTVYATDISADMIEIARSKVKMESLQFDVADILNMNYSSSSFDGVISQFGLMLIEDKLSALKEIRRVLKPGGWFLFSVWSSPSYNELWAVASKVIRAFADIRTGATERIGPFSFSEPQKVDILLKQSGFRETSFSIQQLFIKTEDVTQLAKGFVYGLPFRTLLDNTKGVVLDEVVNTLTLEFRRRFGEQPLQTSLSANVFLSY